jgi:hypothetical protein
MSIVKLNNNGVKNATAFGSITGLGSMTFIKKLTASSSGTLSFVDGSSGVTLDNSYKEYLFTFNNMHPASDNVTFQVGFRDGSTDYDATKTSTFFRAYHLEDDSGTSLEYVTAQDLAQSTNFQSLTEGTGGDNDQSCSGTLHLFNPSSTTFVKHFIATVNNAHAVNLSENLYVAGYCNVTAAIDAVQFKFSSGNIDAGDICLYGIA